MNWILIIVCIAVVIGLLLPLAQKQIVYKKLTKYLEQVKYKEFEKLLDGFWCTFSYRPFNREFMRLNAYFMQNDAKRIQKQLDNLFENIKMNDEQKSSVAKQAFYFYMEQKKYAQAKKMLDICQAHDTNKNEIETMHIMYSILGERKSEHIRDIKAQLEPLQKEKDAYTNPAKRVRIGVFEYLIGLQYLYMNNKKSKEYLNNALQHCKGTTYEAQIQALL